MPHSRLVIRFLFLNFIFLSFSFFSFAQTGAEDFLQTLSRARTAGSSQKWTEAAAEWEKVVAANPVTPDYWRQLGNAHYNNKNYRRAIQAFEEAIKLYTSAPANTAYSIAKAYAALGEKEQALQWLEKSFAYGYRYLQTAQREEVFQSFRTDPRFQKLVALVDTTKMSRAEGWRYDLEFLSREVKRRSVPQFHKTSLKDFETGVQRLHDEIPKLNDWQIIIEMMKLMKMIGDGHSMIYAFWERPEFLKLIPVDFAFFKEGLFVTSTDNRYEDLLGARILKFDNSTVENVLQKLDAITNRDNEMAVLVLGTMRMRNLPMLHALGLINDAEKVSLTITDREG